MKKMIRTCPGAAAWSAWMSWRVAARSYVADCQVMRPAVHCAL
ncbi:hypothetical protein AB0I34_38360 [Kribbella sp. NPDC050281]